MTFKNLSCVNCHHITRYIWGRHKLSIAGRHNPNSENVPATNGFFLLIQQLNYAHKISLFKGECQGYMK